MPTIRCHKKLFLSSLAAPLCPSLHLGGDGSSSHLCKCPVVSLFNLQATASGKSVGFPQSSFFSGEPKFSFDFLFLWQISWGINFIFTSTFFRLKSFPLSFVILPLRVTFFYTFITLSPILPSFLIHRYWFFERLNPEFTLPLSVLASELCSIPVWKFCSLC